MAARPPTGEGSAGCPPTTEEPPARLSNAQVGEVLALTRDTLDAQIRQVHFFDTPDLLLNAAERRAFLAAKGLDVSGEQQTKTRAALEFFSAELSEEQGAQPADVPG